MCVLPFRPIEMKTGICVSTVSIVCTTHVYSLTPERSARDPVRAALDSLTTPELDMCLDRFLGYLKGGGAGKHYRATNFRPLRALTYGHLSDMS